MNSYQSLFVNDGTSTVCLKEQQRDTGGKYETLKIELNRDGSFHEIAIFADCGFALKLAKHLAAAVGMELSEKCEACAEPETPTPSGPTVHDFGAQPAVELADAVPESEAI